MKRVIVLVALASCGVPPLKLIYKLDDTAGDSCGASDCSGVPMSCDSVVSIRVIDPENKIVYDRVCKKVTGDAAGTLCPIAGVLLDDTPLPEKTLDVQVAVYPASQIMDLDGDGQLDCPDNIQYATGTGFPVDGQPVAVGGHAYYHAGDESVIVSLACTNKGELACSAEQTIPFSTQVYDFGFRIPIDSNTAMEIVVFAAAPQVVADEHAIEGAFRQQLDPVTTSGSNFAKDVKILFPDEACIETNVSAAHAVTCIVPEPNATSIDITPSWAVDDPTAKAILDAAGEDDIVPPGGIVIGQVVDGGHQLVPGYPVAVSPPGTLLYLTNGGGTTTDFTQSTGIFVSKDAPYGSIFSTLGKTGGAVTTRAGLIQGKVSIAVLNTETPTNP